jgi:hypothetical protein
MEMENTCEILNKSGFELHQIFGSRDREYRKGLTRVTYSFDEDLWYIGVSDDYGRYISPLVYCDHAGLVEILQDWA